MASLLGDVVAAGARPLSLRMRPDLVVSPQELAGERVWVVKDAVALRYYHLAEEEYLVLSMLDGRSSADDLATAFAARFAPRRLGMAQLQDFLHRLHQEGLVLSGAHGQGIELSERRHRRQRRAWLDAWTDLLAIRFRGVDPDPFLRRLNGSCGWLFSRTCCVVLAMMMALTGLLAAMRYEEFRSRLPDLSSLLTAERLVWLAVALAGVKVLHELGHGLACRRFGGECHELGLMLLVFTPCLYCDVSDAWMNPSRWARIATSAAGIYVEAILATGCTLVWWTAGLGSLQAICFSVMTVCSVNTLLINGNPLLRYDGYHVLSDLLQVPNLSEQSQSLLFHSLAKGCLGLDLFAERQLPQRHRGFLMLYAAASLGYRMLLVAVVLWLMHAVLRPWGLAVVVWLVAAIVVGKMFVIPWTAAVVSLVGPARRGMLRWRRVLTTGGLLAALFTGLLVPLPHHLRVPAILSPQGAQSVYVNVSGRLIEGIVEGKVVSRGQTLARLANPDLELTLSRLLGDSGRLRCRMRYLEAHRTQEHALASQIPATRESLAELEQQILERRREQEQLVLKAPCDGTVLPPPRRQAGTPAAAELPPVEGVEPDQRNLGAWLPTGTFYCRVGDPDRLEAILRVEQDEVDQIKPGDRVLVRPNERPGELLEGVIEEIGKVDEAGRAHAAAETGRSHSVDAADTHGSHVYYQARVGLMGPRSELVVGSAAYAKVVVAPQSLFDRACRSVGTLIHF